MHVREVLFQSFHRKISLTSLCKWTDTYIHVVVMTFSSCIHTVQRKAPKIFEQPKPYIEATAGGTLQLVITVSGEGRLRYKWYKDTRELVYATSNTLEIPNINQLDNGQYCCAIANDHGSILSEIYQVSVLQRPTDRG